MKAQLRKQFLSYFRFESFPWVVPLIHKLSNKKALKKGCITDIETTGLHPNTDMILTLGVLKRNIIFIYQLTNNEYDRFWSLCVNIVSKAPKPRYGYNTRFEAEFLGIKKDWQDLTQYARAHEYNNEWGCNPPYYRLRLEDATTAPFKEPSIQGSEVPQYWKAWLKKKNPKHLYEISYHNLCDLLRTRQLVK